MLGGSCEDMEISHLLLFDDTILCCYICFLDLLCSNFQSGVGEDMMH